MQVEMQLLFVPYALQVLMQVHLVQSHQQIVLIAIQVHIVTQAQSTAPYVIREVTHQRQQHHTAHNARQVILLLRLGPSHLHLV